MKKFIIEWKELKEILSERPNVIEVQLLEPNIIRKFKFVKDKEGKPFDTGEYWERYGKFIIQDVESKKKYSTEYYESGEFDDMQMFGEKFEFIEEKKITKK